MSHAARNRGRRRVQPYAWLGAGAVTLGLGAGMIGGAAVAFADPGVDSSPGASQGPSDSKAASANDAPGKKAARAPRVAVKAADDSSPAVGPARRGRASATVDNPPAAVEPGPQQASVPDVTPEAAVRAAAAVTPTSDSAAPVAENPVTTAPAAPKRSSRAAREVVVEEAAPSLSDAAVVADDAVTSDPAPAAAVAPAAADPAPSTYSWLPGGDNPGAPIVPGKHLEMALDQITAAKDLLNQETWGSGNFLAGLGAIAPQVLLASAQLVYGAWAATNPGVQDFLANTVGIPLIHQIAQAAVFNELLLPGLAQASLAVANALIPTLGWVGADVTETQALVAAAKENGKVYAVVPIRMVLGTQPMVNAKIAGGRNASLLLDTGASGLVTTRDKIGNADLGPMIGEGNSCFSGGLCYHYETYNTTVDLGGGAYTTAPVNLVTDNEEYPNSVAGFKQFFSWGADGILGTGANSAGPGPSPIPNAAMPGELSDGVLVFQNLFWGLGGVMILGPNPLPTRISLPGAPVAYVKVSVDDGPLSDAGAIIDSGGVYGTLPKANDTTGTSVGSMLPAGTKISVYAADGTTLLWSYKTGSGAKGTPVTADGLMGSPNVPFKQNPIYVNYAYPGDPESPNYGIGSTDFSIW